MKFLKRLGVAFSQAVITTAIAGLILFLGIPTLQFLYVVAKSYGFWTTWAICSVIAITCLNFFVRNNI